MRILKTAKRRCLFRFHDTQQYLLDIVCIDQLYDCMCHACTDIAVMNIYDNRNWFQYPLNTYPKYWSMIGTKFVPSGCGSQMAVTSYNTDI